MRVWAPISPVIEFRMLVQLLGAMLAARELKRRDFRTGIPATASLLFVFAGFEDAHTHARS